MRPRSGPRGLARRLAALAVLAASIGLGPAACAGGAGSAAGEGARASPPGIQAAPSVSPAVRSAAAELRPRLIELAGGAGLDLGVAVAGDIVWRESPGATDPGPPGPRPLGPLADLVARVVLERLVQDERLPTDSAPDADARCERVDSVLAAAGHALAAHARGAFRASGSAVPGLAGPCDAWAASAEDVARFGSALIGGRLLEERRMLGLLEPGQVSLAHGASEAGTAAILMDAGSNVVVVLFSDRRDPGAGEALAAAAEAVLTAVLDGLGSPGGV